MRRNIIIIWAAFILMIAASIGIFTLQTPPNWPPENLEFHQQLVFNTIIALSHITGAVLFLANLDVYKKKLRRAYIILATGTVLTGVGTLQISLLTLFNLWETPYGQSAAIMMPFLLSGIILYLAIRSFARLVGVKDIMLKPWVAVPGALALAVLSTLLPHAANPTMTEAAYDGLVGVTVWSGSLMLFAGYLTYRVQQNAGQHYTHAIRWLKRALIVSALVLLYVGVYSLVYVELVYGWAVFNSMTAVVSGFVWVRAGYAFALTKYYDTNVSMIRLLLAGPPKTVNKATDSVIDMVTTTAGLVSNVTDIDPLLDRVRVITSKLKPGEKPSPEDSTELVKVYIEIERYLTTKEVIRTFSIQELRSRLSPNLEQLVDDYASKG